MISFGYQLLASRNMKSFVIPEIYKSNIIGKIKEARRSKDKLKKDFTPTVLDFGSVKFLIARHFGFCYGVENAVEIAYKTIKENPDKRIFFLSEMIHNPDVNADLLSQGVQFLMDTKGNQLIDWQELKPEDSLDCYRPAFSCGRAYHTAFGATAGYFKNCKAVSSLISLTALCFSPKSSFS